jgi:dipeptidyl aminopeptidase/acylaminoacyl peptidase
VTFSATAVADAPAALAKVSADSQTGFVNRQLAPPPEVRVGDRFGNALPGVSVAWAVTTGRGTVSAPATNTGPSGLASVSWTLGTASGPNELEATVAGVAPVRFSATAVAGGPGRIAFNRDDFEIYLMTAEGTGLTQLTSSVASDYAPSWSPDGSKIAFTTSRFGNLEIAVMNADGSGVARLTNDTRVDEVPAWSPDGQRIAFTREWAADRWDIYVMNADGSGVTNVTNNMKNAGGPTWSPDVSKIAFWGRVNPGDPTQIWVINVDGSGLTGLNVEGTPAWSPDGSKIAYQSDRIYLMNPDGSGVTAIADSAYGAPAWAPDGSRIAFTSRRNGIVEIYSVTLDGSGLVRLTNHPATEYNVAWGR